MRFSLVVRFDHFLLSVLFFNFLFTSPHKMIFNHLFLVRWLIHNLCLRITWLEMTKIHGFLFAQFFNLWWPLTLNQVFSFEIHISNRILKAWRINFRLKHMIRGTNWLIRIFLTCTTVREWFLLTNLMRNSGTFLWLLITVSKWFSFTSCASVHFFFNLILCFNNLFRCN